MRASALLFVIALLLPGLLPGQDAAAPAREVSLTLKSALCHGPHDPPRGGTQCGLGDTVEITFANLAEWVESDPVRHDPRQLVLALNGREIPGTHAGVMAAGGNTLTFDLAPPESSDPEADASRQAWRAILHGHRKISRMSALVGTKGGNVFYGPLTLSFDLYPSYAWLVFVVLGVIAVSVILLALRSDLIRAPGPDPGPGLKRPYSLGRVQMVYWFVIVIGSYLYIWLITLNQDSLTSGVLILTGISAATGLSSVIAGASAAKTPTGDGAAPPESTPVKVPASRGFVNDLLGTEAGVSFDRFQMTAWTVVLGLVFIVQVIKDLSMPDFSPALLSLMGISSGTYIGFKLPGKSQVS